MPCLSLSLCANYTLYLPRVLSPCFFYTCSQALSLNCIQALLYSLSQEIRLPLSCSRLPRLNLLASKPSRYVSDSEQQEFLQACTYCICKNLRNCYPIPAKMSFERSTMQGHLLLASPMSMQVFWGGRFRTHTCGPGRSSHFLIILTLLKYW